MKYTAASALLLLLTVTDLSFRRSIPTRKLHERQVDLLGPPKKHILENVTCGIAECRQLDDIEPLPKRADFEPIEVDPPESAGGGAEGGGTETSPPGNEAGGSLSNEAPDSEHGGSSGSAPMDLDSPSPPVAAEPPASVAAPKPAGLDGVDETKLWNYMTNGAPTLQDTDQLILYSGDNAYQVRDAFKAALAAKNPGVTFKHVFDMTEDPSSSWGDNYGEYIEDNLDTEYRAKAVLSIKYAELIANHPQNVHVLYSVPDGNTLPEGSYLTIAEMGVVTAPGTKVPQMFRYEVGTFAQTIEAGAAPPVVWTPSAGQLSTPLIDLTTDPKASDDSSLSDAMSISSGPSPRATGP